MCGINFKHHDLVQVHAKQQQSEAVRRAECNNLHLQQLRRRLKSRTAFRRAIRRPLFSATPATDADARSAAGRYNNLDATHANDARRAFLQTSMRKQFYSCLPNT